MHVCKKWNLTCAYIMDFHVLSHETEAGRHACRERGTPCVFCTVPARCTRVEELCSKFQTSKKKKESVRLLWSTDVLFDVRTVCPPQCHKQSVVLIWTSVTSSSAVNSGYEIILKSETRWRISAEHRKAFNSWCFPQKLMVEERLQQPRLL